MGARAAAAEERVQRMRAIFDHSAVGMALLDASAAVVHANGAFERLLGYELAQVRGRPITSFIAAGDAAAVAEVVREVGSGEKSSSAAEARLNHPDGSVVWGVLTISDAGDRLERHLVAVLQDVTERKALEARLVHQAYHDPLTELANRELFRERVEHALARSARAAEQLAVIFLDLDNFKTINDTLGHGAGDRLLQSVARRLLGAVRGCDTVARLGGDEFAVLLEDVDARAGAESAAERIVAALRHPAPADRDHRTRTSASIGIAVYTGEEDSETLLRNADVAMYEAKLHTTGRWIIYKPGMHASLLDRVTLEADLQRALEQSSLRQNPHLANTGVFHAIGTRAPAAAAPVQLRVAYQPIVDLHTGRITGVESLARWTHPERGVVSPEVFIPAAERSGLICNLGRWVLREACLQGAAWNRQYPEAPITITVNLSAKQMEIDTLAIEVEGILRESGLAPSRLILEITETVIMQNAEATLVRLQELKRLGIGLAIDDFGTGYSSLAYLQRFPVDVVKIDRVFTDELRRGTEGAALIRMILALAELLHLRTIAEGVEDDGQREALRALGCTAAQGYLFGRPCESREIEAMLTAQLTVPAPAPGTPVAADGDACAAVPVAASKPARRPSRRAPPPR